MGSLPKVSKNSLIPLWQASALKGYSHLRFAPFGTANSIVLLLNIAKLTGKSKNNTSGEKSQLSKKILV
jgi:hypothetical protein